MALLAAARSFQAAQAALRDLVKAALAALWGELDRDDLSGSWTRLRTAERAFVTVSAYQALAARQAGQWVQDAVTEQGGTPTDVAVEPLSFAGRTSDGAELEPRLYAPIIRAKTAIRDHKPADEAIVSAGKVLRSIGATEVSDAARAATQAALTAQKGVSGWVRLVNLPACGRCVAQAGKQLRWHQPIRTHPGCDCNLAPSAIGRADELLVDPVAYFHSLSPEEQAERFGVGAAKEIRAGRDPADAVGVNESRSGLSVVGDLSPKAKGHTARSLLNKADGDRDEAIRLLREYGFLL